MKNKEFNLYIDGKPVEVSETVYREYQCGERRERYYAQDLKVERIVVDQQERTVTVIPSREDSFERLLAADKQFAAPGESPEEQTVRSVLLESAMEALTDEDRRLIRELYYLDKTEREVSAALHIAKTTLRRKRERILEKLRGLLKENF